MRKVLSFALGLIALSPIAVSAEELNRRLYPNAHDDVQMDFTGGMFRLDGDVEAFEKGEDTYVVVGFSGIENDLGFAVTYYFNCNTQFFERQSAHFSYPYYGDLFIEGLIKPYGNRFCAIDRGASR